MKFVLITVILALITILAWMIIATIELHRQNKELIEDYLHKENDSFINPNVETYNEIIEDLYKEERYLNYLNKNKEYEK